MLRIWDVVFEFSCRMLLGVSVCRRGAESFLCNLVVEKGVDMEVVGQEERVVKGGYNEYKEDDRRKNIEGIVTLKAGAVLEGSKE